MLRYLNTAIGRKNVEAVTGTMLLLFCLEHLVANLFLLDPDPSTYRWLTESLGRSLIVRMLEIALFALFIIHIGLGLNMRWHHRTVRRKNPRIPKSTKLSTRTVGWTGAAILLFLIVHLTRFFIPNRLIQPEGYDLYDQAHLAFSNPWYTLFYVASMAALGFHLRHGIKSAIVSFKRIPPSTIPRMRKVGGWLAVVIPAGLAYIALHICFVHW